MQQLEELTFQKFYHIYNRGINGCDLFKVKENYEYFLNLYDKHISPIADTFTWVLMRNHFHLLVRIKEEGEIKKPEGLLPPNLTGFENLSGLRSPSGFKSPKPHQYFSNLFNAYAKGFNKTYGRHGALFERPFKRKEITDIDYFKTVVVYIHNNPVHHGFTEYAMDYPWSSYLTCISIKPTHLEREEVIGWFDNEANFKNAHDNRKDVTDLEKWLGL